jgi:hypothetical protein
MRPALRHNVIGPRLLPNGKAETCCLWCDFRVETPVSLMAAGILRATFLDHLKTKHNAKDVT